MGESLHDFSESKNRLTALDASAARSRGKVVLPFLPLSPSGCMCLVTLCPFELYLGSEPLLGASSTSLFSVGEGLPLGSRVGSSDGEASFRPSRFIVDAKYCDIRRISGIQE